jgi:hypothetical protein
MSEGLRSGGEVQSAEEDIREHMEGFFGGVPGRIVHTAENPDPLNHENAPDLHVKLIGHETVGNFTLTRRLGKFRDVEVPEIAEEWSAIITRDGFVVGFVDRSTSKDPFSVNDGVQKEERAAAPGKVLTTLEWLSRQPIEVS